MIHLENFVTCQYTLETQSRLLFEETISRSVMVVKKDDGPYSFAALNDVHSPLVLKERVRIDQYNGYVKSVKIHPAVPAVPRVFANKECTRGGLAMSRSIGDQRMHKFGISSDSETKRVCLSDHCGKDILIIVGSDGLLEYVNKNVLISLFPLESESELDSALTKACEKSQACQLKLTNGRYADDSSGIVVHLRLFIVCYTHVPLY